jgi:hypothetical protein
MKDFTIHFEPPMEESNARISPPQSLAAFTPTRKLINGQRAYSVFYQIGAERFGYGLSTLLDVLTDIHLEWERVISKKSHDMTICEYTVLQMEICDDRIRFFRSPVNLKNHDEKSVGRTFKWSEIEGAFRRATGLVWNLVQQIE